MGGGSGAGRKGGQEGAAGGGCRTKFRRELAKSSAPGGSWRAAELYNPPLLEVRFLALRTPCPPGWAEICVKGWGWEGEAPPALLLGGAFSGGGDSKSRQQPAKRRGRSVPDKRQLFFMVGPALLQSSHGPFTGQGCDSIQHLQPCLWFSWKRRMKDEQRMRSWREGRRGEEGGGHKKCTRNRVFCGILKLLPPPFILIAALWGA